MSARKSRLRRQEERARRSLALARFIRRACSSCSGPRIQWLDVDQARAEIGAAWVDEVEAWMGPGDGITEVWRCLDCGDCGAFGRAHDDWVDALDARMTGSAGVRPPV